MTTTATAPVTRNSGGVRKPPPPVRKPVPVAVRIAGSAFTLLAIMMLTFVAEAALVGHVRHAREQNVAYAEFRAQLAAGEAPTGQLDFEGNQLDLGAPVALISVPKIGVQEVVLEGTTAGVLMDGPGHRRDTPLPGQAGVAVIMGRQATYGGPFGKISELGNGDEIAVRTAQGASLFEVTGVRRAGDPYEPAAPEEGTLTLITGDGTPYLPSEVVRVDAELVTPVLQAPSRPIAPGTLPDSEASMEGDPGVLLPLLLWSQLLLVLAGLLTWMSSQWGFWQSWIVCVPIMAAAGLQVAHLVAQLLPNLI